MEEGSGSSLTGSHARARLHQTARAQAKLQIGAKEKMPIELIENSDERTGYTTIEIFI